MSRWPLVALGSVTTVIGGGTPKTGKADNWDGTIPWVTPKDLSTQKSRYIERGSRQITEVGLSSSSAVLLPAGTVLWSSRAPIGLTAIARNPISTNQGFKSFVPIDSAISSEYLYHFLRTNQGTLQSYGSGATFKEVSTKRAREIMIPLPPLDEQRRLARILDKSQSALNQTQSQSFYTEELSRIIPNTADASEVLLSHYVSSVTSGKNVAEVDSNTSGAKVLKVSSVTSGKFRRDEAKLLPDSYKAPKGHLVERGDLIVSRANTQELVGASALVQETLQSTYLPDKLWRLNLKENVDRHFLWCLLNSPTMRARISQRASGSSGSMKNISQQNFLSIPVPNFSEPEQARIGARVRNSFQYADLVEIRRALLNELYSSLSARAFAGEL